MADKKPIALIVDDEADIRSLIEMSFMTIGVSCVLAATIKEAIRYLKKGGIDFCVTDMRLPDGDGIDLVAYIQKNYSQIPVCVITAHGNVELAVKSLKLGAFDFVNKPFDLKQLRDMAASALKLVEGEAADLLETKNKESESRAEQTIEIIGDSPVMKKLGEVIKKLARSQAPVFIQGESGTGKELVAKRIHELSARRDCPFIPVNCGAIPESLVESEFFGYKKGAFTGANTDYLGLFASANGGTLFLDEVADLPLAMQVKLLRAIQERAIRPVGGDKEISIDIRILSATHKDLSGLVAQKEFRQDLYYRLNVISIEIPPLRLRGNDIILIANKLLEKLADQHEMQEMKLSDEVCALLQSYPYPGNVRELENVLERAVTFCDGGLITKDDIQFNDEVAAGKVDHQVAKVGADVKKEGLLAEDDDLLVVSDLDGYLESIERKAILTALKRANNNKTRAAEELGISFRAFRYKLKKYGIK